MVPLCQVGHTDKSGQCALVHAALKGHTEIINILLGQDWGSESLPDSEQHHSNENGTGKAQAAQQALTAAGSLGHSQVQFTPNGKMFMKYEDSSLLVRVHALKDL